MNQDNNSLYQLWDEFLKQWPVEKVRSMSIEQYTHAGSKDTFTYWLESRLDKMGSIWGGSAFKFGIFSRNDTATKESSGNRSYDDNYGWHDKYGETPEEAFQTIRAEIVKIIEAVQSKNISLIEEVDFGHAYKWKIAFHYQNRNVPQIIPIFKPEALRAITQNQNKEPISQIHGELIAQMDEGQDLIGYGESLWSKFSGLATIWKISHGKADFPAEERADFLSRQCVTVHKDTKKSQGDAFSEEMNPGDYFYLCHGNDEGIVLFGRITSEATIGNAEDGWLERSYEVIKKLDEPRRYQGIKKGWAPSYNSTVKKVKSNELKLFEEHILNKSFGLSLSDLKVSLAGSTKEGKKDNKVITAAAAEIGLNTIYYGPPGTGKTYKLLTELANELFVDSASTKTELEQAMDLVESNGLSWWQIIAMCLLEIGTPSKVSAIRDHVLMQAKIAGSSNKQPANTIWTHLQTHTKPDCPNVKYAKSCEPLLFWKDEDSRWTIDAEAAKIYTPDLVDLLESFKKNDPEPDNKRYVFTTFHQSFSYEDFVEGIKPVMDEGVESGLSYQIEPGIFKRIAARAQANPESKYAIFIDEINRGNVASIFGELITLIEPDKRLGNDKTEVIVTLPYSKEKFGVPPNLHIIGTMNTADRSIVALDSALRRRFQFEECFPEPELIEQPDDLNVDLQELLKVINSRISMLLDRDHCIGHSYFMGIVKASRSLLALREVFSCSIIPLLEEYFCGDLARVGMILGEKFVQPSSEKDQSITLASGSWDMGLETKDVFQLVDVADLSEEDFASIYE
jgi:5-methylcytosine-specific restriction protein B